MLQPYKPRTCLGGTVERPYTSWPPTLRISQDFFLKVIRSLLLCTLLWTTSVPYHHSCGLRGNDRSVWHPVGGQDKLLSLQKKKKHKFCPRWGSTNWRSGQPCDLRPAEIPKCHFVCWPLLLHGNGPFENRRKTYTVPWRKHFSLDIRKMKLTRKYKSLLPYFDIRTFWCRGKAVGRY